MSEDRKECHKCLNFNKCNENVSYESNYCNAHRKQRRDKNVANMENYECLKSELLQRPISFLTEENLDKLETHCRKAANFERGVEHKVVLELLERYYQYQKEIQDKNNKIKKQQKQLDLIKEYVHQEIVHYTEDIRDYIDDDKEGNKHIISELKEDREHWKDIEKILQNKSREELYMNWWEVGLYE